jgi:hypothetical protein
MITEGVFSLRFESDKEQMGKGFAVFKDGRIRGGDEEFMYGGTYVLEPAAAGSEINFQANVTVQYYKGINLAILGKMTRFPVELSGVFTPEKLFAHGKIKKFGSDAVDLHGLKLDDFQEAVFVGNEHVAFQALCSGMNAESRRQVDTVVALCQQGSYIDATNTMMIMIDSLVSSLLLNNGGSNGAQSGHLRERLNILVNRGVISDQLPELAQVLADSEKILTKKSNAPEDCAFPLCTIAFNLLQSLLTLQQPV